MTRMQTRDGFRQIAKSAGRRGVLVFWAIVFVVGLLGPMAFVVTRVDAQTVTPTAGGTYIVQPGDSWTSLSRRTGISIRELQAANPRAVRPTGWLIVGEELILPGVATPTASATVAATPSPAAAADAPSAETVSAGDTAAGDTAAGDTAAGDTAAGDTAAGDTAAGDTAAADTEAQPTTETGAQIYIVQPGESWNSIAQKFGVSAEALRAANPRAVRPGLVLFRNEQLIIPAQPDSTSAAATPSTPTAPAPQTPAATPTAAEEAALPETPAPAEEAQEADATSVCPEDFANYPALVEASLAATGDMEDVLSFLRDCNALSEENVRRSDWNGDGVADWVIVLQNPLSDAALPETELLIFMSGEDGYTLSYQARPAGQVNLLAASDINLDGQPDLVWVDTTCGASTCFDAVIVRSWDGAEWADWSERAIVMAYAQIKLDELRDFAQGSEIVLQGGEYGSVGAGPQRSRTEVWGSIDGTPYQLLDTVYARSNCLYFKVLDANEALNRYQEIGLTQAREMYNEAVTSRSLVKCGQRSDELNELRSFSLFRLAVIHAYEGDAELAAETVAQLQDAFADSVYTPMATVWLDAYQTTGDPADACITATAYAEENPETYTSLSDYGYANPTFTAADLCPVLAIDPQQPTTAVDVEFPEIVETTPITPLLTLPATTDVTAIAPVAPGQAGELPGCPSTLDEYASVLPEVIALAEGDALIVETWLRLCDGMTDTRGGMLLADFNDDGLEDALFLPTIVSDLGFGPGGAQGAVLIYHGNSTGGFDLVYSPEIYGQPTLLAAADLNGDRRIDLAWTIEGCSTFCVKEVQMVTWDRQRRIYISIIDPGATIAEGRARIIEAPEGATGQGQQLLLAGGVSGTADGGLKIEHEEIWQSVDGRPFRRLSWTYDRNNSSSTCVGLRLIEADVALHAADILGYEPAIELYRSALDPAMKACSIYGVPAPEELKLLQGLATFRLIQAQALAGNIEAAKLDLAALQQGQPGSAFAKAAEQWLDTYVSRTDATIACREIQPIFDKETLTWQITDHFGYNHPALAPEQVCFVPRGG